MTQEGIDYRLPEFRDRDGKTRILYLWDQTLRPSEPSAGSDAGFGADSEPDSQREEGPGTEINMESEINFEIEAEPEINMEQEPRRPPEGFNQGVEFNSDQINRALDAPDGQQQFQLFPSVDTSGHGSAVAGIAAGSSAVYRGVAPEAELLVVKLGLPDASSFPRTTEIMRAVTYTVNKAIELQMPVVINLSFGNTYGAHDGSSLIERFLDNAAEIGRTVICVGSGNEGASDGHLSGSLSTGQGVLRQNGGFAGAGGGAQGAGALGGIGGGSGALVELSVAAYERNLNVQLWKNYSDVYRVTLRSPGGQESPLPEAVEGGKYTLRLEQTEVLVYIGEPTPYYMELSFGAGKNSHGKLLFLPAVKHGEKRRNRLLPFHS